MLRGLMSGLIAGSAAGKAVYTAIVFGIAGCAAGRWRRAAVVAFVASLMCAPGCRHGAGKRRAGWAVEPAVEELEVDVPWTWRMRVALLVLIGLVASVVCTHWL